MPDIDIHDTSRKLILLEARLQASPIPDQDKQQLFQFRDHLFVQGLGSARVLKYLVHLKSLYELVGGSILEAREQAIISLLANIQRSTWTAWTKHDYLLVLRRYLQYNQQDDLAALIKLPKVHTQKLPEELLTPVDIRAMITAASSPDDILLVVVLYESGCRIGEVLTLQHKHITFDTMGAILIVHGKTGWRRVRITESAPYLDEWICQANPGPEDRLFPLKYATANKRIKVMARRAGINKRVYPHLFRHSRATFLAGYLTMAQLCQYLGWTMGSDMARIYIHLSGAELDPVITRLPCVLNPDQHTAKPGLQRGVMPLKT